MVATGIPQLEAILGGPLPAGDVVLLLGAAGTGKTTLVLQASFHLARRGQDAAFVSTFSESPEKLLRHAESFRFFDESLVGQRLHLRSLYPLIGDDPGALLEALVDTVRDHGARLLVLDGLASIRDLLEDGRRVRRFIYDLGTTLATLDAVTLITSSVTGDDDHHRPELTMADGVLVLAHETLGTRSVRSLRVQKMRGRTPLLGRHSMRIDDDGIVLAPRLESLVEPTDTGLAGTRAGTGVNVLDTLMHGGPPTGSLTTVAGAPATGKTLLGLGFIGQGLARGETGVIVGFRESPQQLIDKAEAFGIELGDAVRDDRVRIIHRPPVDLDVDEVALQLRTALEAVGARRAVVDTISDLDEAILDDRRHRGYMAALAALLRQHRVTSLVTLEVPQVAGPALDLGGAPIAVLAESLVLLRNLERQGRLQRVLSVVKMRDSAYDSALRQYRITERGLDVLDPDPGGRPESEGRDPPFGPEDG